MVKMLEVNDAAMQKLMLEAVGTLLEAGETLQKTKGGENPFLVAFDEADGVDKLSRCRRTTTRRSTRRLSNFWRSFSARTVTMTRTSCLMLRMAHSRSVQTCSRRLHSLR